MHYTGRIFDYTRLGCSHVLAIYPCNNAISFADHAECCIQGCIRMEQGNWMEEEDESIIRKSFFLGIGFGNNGIKPKRIISKLSAASFKEKQVEWNSRMIAKQLRRLADNFEAEFQNVYETTHPHRDKNVSVHCSSIIKYISNMVNGRQFFN
ncbi:unnamed protein product [Cercopithifilaria johnstoni]|uniref:Uncharacterized protein n=1 Tax=Cercopithifilaria johnstoni TaxID=2874296 RepID=A0A8J2MVQ3_9BILA|nr:unnamed protein product [Cercopithifilaria johnstoni]